MGNEADKQEQIKETGSLDLKGNQDRGKIRLLTIIGEIEGHETLSFRKYKSHKIRASSPDACRTGRQRRD